MKITKNNRRYCTTGQVAEICGVGTRTVCKWCDNGLLPHFRLPGSKDRRVLLGDLARFLRENIPDIRIADKILSQPSVILFSDNAQVVEVVEEVARLVNRKVQIVTDFFSLGETIQQSQAGRWVAILDTAMGTTGVSAALIKIAGQGRVMILTTEDDHNPSRWLAVGAVIECCPASCDSAFLRRLVAELCQGGCE